jgi:glycosyltransferase involved in cell wall biosynthesis
MALRQCRILAFPKSGYPYIEEFYRAVEAEGLSVVDGDFGGSWLWSNINRGDWVHLHWPSFDYHVKAGRWALIQGFLRWIILLILIRFKGARIIWTAHNLLPHDRAAIPFIDVLGRYLVIALADVILVHGANAAASLVASFPSAEKKLLKIPHGHWIGYYPNSVTREAARAQLGISASLFVYLFIGVCKPYKNLDGLVRAFHELPGDSILIVVGCFTDPSYQEEILALAQGNPRIRIEPGFVPNEMMQIFLMACDAVVVPYREILTSGTAILALSFGRPIVSVSLGFLKDIVNPEVGILFAPDEPEGLLNALREVCNQSYDCERILQHARSFTFEKAAKILVGTLHVKSEN